MREAIEYAKAKVLKADDHRWGLSVQLVLNDGSTFFISNAFIEGVQLGNYGHKWTIVYTEHYGYFIYPSDDILFCGEFEACFSRDPV